MWHTIISPMQLSRRLRISCNSNSPAQFLIFHTKKPLILNLTCSAIHLLSFLLEPPLLPLLPLRSLYLQHHLSGFRPTSFLLLSVSNSLINPFLLSVLLVYMYYTCFLTTLFKIIFSATSKNNLNSTHNY